MTKVFFRPQKIWFFVLPLALFFGFLLSFSVGSTAYAASAYDDAVQLIDTADVVSPNGSFVQDLSTTWFSTLQSSDFVDCPAAVSAIQSLDYDNGAALGVSTFINDGGQQQGVYIYWSTSGGQLGFGVSGDKHFLSTSGTSITSGNGGSGVGSAYILASNAGDLTVACFASFSLGSNIVSDNGQGSSTHSKIVFTSWPINYPDGYAGSIPPPTYASKPVLRPDLDYSVADLSVVARDEKQNLPKYTPAAGYYFKGYSIEWFLFKCGQPWDDVTKSCSDTTVDNTQTLPIGSKYETDASEHGDYILSAEYVATECYRYPSYPATPDNCYLLSLKTQFPDYDFKPTTVYLNMDGKTFSGSTGNLECDVSGYCEPPDDGLGMFHSLDDMNTFGLSAFLTAPIDFYAKLPQLATTCSPITVPFIGSTYTFTLECMKSRYQTWSPAIFSIWQTVLIAGVGWLIAFNIFRTIKNINTPDKDGIEVAKL